MPQFKVRLTPNTSCPILTHKPAHIRTGIIPSLSYGKAFPQPSLGIIREVRKLCDFLLHGAGSERRLAAAVSAPWTRPGTHTSRGWQPALEELCDLRSPWAEAGEDSINTMNEGATVIMSLILPVTSTHWLIHKDLQPQTSIDMHTHTHTQTRTLYASINRQLIYKWADLCVGLALR